jgi:hypothetical protein
MLAYRMPYRIFQEDGKHIQEDGKHIHFMGEEQEILRAFTLRFTRPASRSSLSVR